jgi:hypothetical protein
VKQEHQILLIRVSLPSSHIKTKGNKDENLRSGGLRVCMAVQKIPVGRIHKLRKLLSDSVSATYPQLLQHIVTNIGVEKSWSTRYVKFDTWSPSIVYVRRFIFFLYSIVTQ